MCVCVCFEHRAQEMNLHRIKCVCIVIYIWRPPNPPTRASDDLYPVKYTFKHSTALERFIFKTTGRQVRTIDFKVYHPVVVVVVVLVLPPLCQQLINWTSLLVHRFDWWNKSWRCPGVSGYSPFLRLADRPALVFICCESHKTTTTNQPTNLVVVFRIGRRPEKCLIVFNRQWWEA